MPNRADVLPPALVGPSRPPQQDVPPAPPQRGHRLVYHAADQVLYLVEDGYRADAAQRLRNKPDGPLSTLTRAAAVCKATSENLHIQFLVPT